MMGASAQECSAFRPIFPFLKMMKVNDLSNHLREKTELSVYKDKKKNTRFLDGPKDRAPTPQRACGH